MVAPSFAWQLLDDRVVVRVVYHDIDEAVVFRGCPDHGGAADIDVLYGVFQGAIGLRNGRLEGVQVDHHHVDGLDAVVGHHRVVLAAAGENAAVHFRVQGFDPAVHHFREACVVGHFGHLQAAVLQQAIGAAGGQQVDPHVQQRLGEFDDAGLVRNADQGAIDFHKLLVAHGAWPP